MLPLAPCRGPLGARAAPVTFRSALPSTPPPVREHGSISAGVACGGISVAGAAALSAQRRGERPRRQPRLSRASPRAAAAAAAPPSPEDAGAEDVDVVVVGAGLAGLGAALAAARAGLRVRIVDAAPKEPGEA